MAVELTDFQGLTAPGVDALRGRWSSVAAPAHARYHVTVTAPMPFAAFGNKPNAIGITGRPQEGSS